MNKFILSKSIISNSLIVNNNNNDIEDNVNLNRKYLCNKSHQCIIKQGKQMKKRADFSHRAINISNIIQILLSNIDISKVDNKSLTLLVVEKKTYLKL